MKIRIKTSIINKLDDTKEILEVNAIKDDKKIVYSNDGAKVTLYYKDKILKRTNNKVTMELDFNTNKGNYIINNNILSLDIDTKEYKVTDKTIYIAYDIYIENYKNGEFIFEVNTL